MLPFISSNNLSFSVSSFFPEILLCGAIVLLLLMRLFKFFDRDHLGPIALGLVLLVLAVTVVQWKATQIDRWLESKEIDFHLRSYLEPPDSGTTGYPQLLFGGTNGVGML